MSLTRKRRLFAAHWAQKRKPSWKPQKRSASKKHPLRAALPSKIRKKLNYTEKKVPLHGHSSGHGNREHSFNAREAATPVTAKQAMAIGAKLRFRANFGTRRADAGRSPNQKKSGHDFFLKFRTEEPSQPEQVQNVYSKARQLGHREKVLLSKSRRIKGKIKSQDYQSKGQKIVFQHNSQFSNYKHLREGVRAFKFEGKRPPNQAGPDKQAPLRRGLSGEDKPNTTRLAAKESSQPANVFDRKLPQRVETLKGIRSKLYTRQSKLIKSKPVTEPLSLSPEHAGQQSRRGSKVSNQSKSRAGLGGVRQSGQARPKRTLLKKFRKKDLGSNQKVKLYKSSQKNILGLKKQVKKRMKISSNKEVSKEPLESLKAINNAGVNSHSLEKNPKIKKNYSQPKTNYEKRPIKFAKSHANNPKGPHWTHKFHFKVDLNKFIHRRFAGIQSKKNHSAEAKAVHNRRQVKSRQEPLKLAIPKINYLRSSDKAVPPQSRDKPSVLKGPRQMQIYQKKRVSKQGLAGRVGALKKVSPGKLKLQGKGQIKSFEVNKHFPLHRKQLASTDVVPKMDVKDPLTASESQIVKQDLRFRLGNPHSLKVNHVDSRKTNRLNQNRRQKIYKKTYGKSQLSRHAKLRADPKNSAKHLFSKPRLAPIPRHSDLKSNQLGVLASRVRSGRVKPRKDSD